MVARDIEKDLRGDTDLATKTARASMPTLCPSVGTPDVSNLSQRARNQKGTKRRTSRRLAHVKKISTMLIEKRKLREEEAQRRKSSAHSPPTDQSRPEGEGCSSDLPMCSDEEDVLAAMESSRLTPTEVPKACNDRVTPSAYGYWPMEADHFVDIEGDDTFGLSSSGDGSLRAGDASLSCSSSKEEEEDKDDENNALLLEEDSISMFEQF